MDVRCYYIAQGLVIAGFGYSFSRLNSRIQEEEKQDPLSSLGVALFKMWVGSVSEQDNELIGKFSRELEILSKEGDIGG